MRHTVYITIFWGYQTPKFGGGEEEASFHLLTQYYFWSLHVLQTWSTQDRSKGTAYY